MEKMNLKKKFDAIIIFNRTLIHLKNEKSLKKLIKKVKEHLNAGGGVLIDLDVHKDFFDVDLSETNYFHKGDLEGSITEEYDLRGNKILWSINLVIKDGKVNRLVDTQEFLLIDAKKLIKILKENGFKVFVFSAKGRPVKHINQHIIVLGKLKK